VVEHQGTFESGHYVAYARLGEGADEWFRMSDSRVSRIDEAAVLRVQAFLLFYRQA